MKIFFIAMLANGKAERTKSECKIYLVKIRRLLVDMFIGVHEHEKRSKRVAIDVEQTRLPRRGF